MIYTIVSNYNPPRYYELYPTIGFTQIDNETENKLIVTSVSPVDLTWEDIDLCVNNTAMEHDNLGIINYGDVIDLTSIAGTGNYTVYIIYEPTNIILNSYNFDSEI